MIQLSKVTELLFTVPYLKKLFFKKIKDLQKMQKTQHSIASFAKNTDICTS